MTNPQDLESDRETESPPAGNGLYVNLGQGPRGLCDRRGTQRLGASPRFRTASHSLQTEKSRKGRQRSRTFYAASVLR